MTHLKRRDFLLGLSGTALPTWLGSYANACAARAAERVLTPEAFGAAGDGKRSDEAAFAALANHLNRTGGNAMVRCRSNAIYAVTADKFIRVSNVTFDGQGCTFTGGGRWEIDGDPKKPGGEPRVRNVHFHNFRLASSGAFNTPKGPRFSWVADSSLSDIVKNGPTGTYFNFHNSRNCHASRLTGIGARDGFGFLMLHCTDCSLTDSVFTDGNHPGTHPIVVQVKGGRGNRVQRVTAHSIRGKPTNAVFFCRGDAPYRRAPDLGTYPYANGRSWADPDDDRQTREALWQDCVAVDCGANNAFLFQESRDCRFVRCASIRSGAFRAISTEGGHERGARFIGCRSESARGDAFNIRGKSGQNPVADVAFEDVTIEAPRGAGFRLAFARRPHLARVSIRRAAGTGLLIEDCDAPALEAIEVRNSGQTGIAVRRTRGLTTGLDHKLRVSGSKVKDLDLQKD